MATNNSIDNKVTSGNFTVTAGNVVVTAGNVTLPTTSATVGQVTINSVSFLHGYGTSNTFVGGAGNLTTSAARTTCIGASAGLALTSGGSDGVFIGFEANKSMTNQAVSSVVVGSKAAANCGNNCVYIGAEAFGNTYASASCSNNIGIGYRALYTGGSSNNNYVVNNIAIGSYALRTLTDKGDSSSGRYNVSIGYASGYNIGQGWQNVFIGSCMDGGYNYGAGSNCNGYDNTNIMISHQGVAGDSSTIRIGNQGTTINPHTKTFIAGIYTYSGTIDATNCGVIIDKNGQMQTTFTNSADANARTFTFMKSRGTRTSPTVITSGDALGVMDFRGHDGTNFIVGSQITSTSSGTIATNRVASDLKFYTHPDSTTASTLRMTIADTGCVTIAAADSGTELTVTGEVSATTVYATTFDTNVAAAGVTLAGTTLAADGSDTDINITLTPKGAGTLVSAAVYSKQVTSNVRTLLVDDGGLIGNATSSLRFKNDVKDMGDDSSAIYKLRPVTFTYKTDDKKKKQYGLIAEEVDKVMPLLVSYDEDGRPHSVSYHDLPQILLNEVIKMRKEIDDLKAQLKGK